MIKSDGTEVDDDNVDVETRPKKAPRLSTAVSVVHDNHDVTTSVGFEPRRVKSTQIPNFQNARLAEFPEEFHVRDGEVVKEPILNALNCAFLSGWIYSKQLEEASSQSSDSNTKLSDDSPVLPQPSVKDASDPVYGKDEVPLDSFLCHAYHPSNEMKGELITWALVYTKSEAELVVYLVFRGTHTLQDVVIDLSYVPFVVNNPINPSQSLMLHSGIVAALLLEMHQIKSCLSSLVLKYLTTGMSLRFYSTGHSLGGGYAQVFGVLFLNDMESFIHMLDGRISIIQPTTAENMSQSSGGICFFSVLSFASPLIAWSKMDDETIRKLNDMNPSLESKIDKKYERDIVRYYVTRTMLDDVYPVQSYIVNFINLKDVVPRAQIAVKSKWTIQNMAKTSVPNISFLVNQVKNLAASSIGDIYNHIPNHLVGYRPLGRSFVIKVKKEIVIKKYRRENVSYSLELRDCSEHNDWFMLEYNKTKEYGGENMYPYSPGYQRSTDDGWIIVDHGVNFYFKHLKACWMPIPPEIPSDELAGKSTA